MSLREHLKQKKLSYKTFLNVLRGKYVDSRGRPLSRASIRRYKSEIRRCKRLGLIKKGKRIKKKKIKDGVVYIHYDAFNEPYILMKDGKIIHKEIARLMKDIRKGIRKIKRIKRKKGKRFLNFSCEVFTDFGSFVVSSKLYPLEIAEYITHDISLKLDEILDKASLRSAFAVNCSLNEFVYTGVLKIARTEAIKR